MKQTKEDIMAEILGGCVLERLDNPYKGGQSCGIMRLPWKISHPEYQITITSGEMRSDYENRELCKTLFSLAISECLKL